MRIITKKQELEILKRIYANHKIVNAEIADIKSLMHYTDNEAEIVSNALGLQGLRTMARLIERELEQEELEDKE